MKVLVAGASGFIGSRLCPALVSAGHEVQAMTRRPESYRGAGTAVAGDVDAPETLNAALVGCEAAYYLVHALDQEDFAERDAASARAFGRAAAAAGVQRIVYLGGLGQDDGSLSAHLRSRREVERELAVGGAQVVALRAGVVVGHGSTSWELTRQLVEHLPMMITPRWVSTRCQPIAVGDVIRYLVGALTLPVEGNDAFDIGGPEILEYKQMLARVATIEGRHLAVVPVPFLTPSLSSRWLALVTDLDVTTGRALIDSMTNEVIVRDDRLRRLLPFTLTEYDDMVLQALGERARARRDQPPGPTGLFARLSTPVPRGEVESGAALLRRRAVAAGTGIAGSALLRRTLRTRPGSLAFYGNSTALATTWAAGALASGPLHLGREHAPDQRLRRPTLVPIGIGVAAFGGLYGAARVARHIPWLRDQVASVLEYAEAGKSPLVLATTLASGAAEEMFFRGALFAAVPEPKAVPVSSAAYTLATAATANPALVLAAGAMGTLFGLQRHATGGIQASMLTHVTWSSLTLRYLPPLFRRNSDAVAGR